MPIGMTFPPLLRLLIYVLVLLNLVNEATYVTHATIVAGRDDPIVRHRQQHHYVCQQRSERQKIIQSTPWTFSRNASFIHGRVNGQLFDSTSLQSTRQLHRFNEQCGNSDNTKDQPEQQAEKKQQHAVVIEETNCVEEDDGGSFFLEASRQAARNRQLQLMNASSPSSSISSMTNNYTVVDGEGDDGDANDAIAPGGIKEEDDEDGAGVEIHKLASNGKVGKETQVHTDDEETKPLEDNEPLTISENGLMAETAATIENEEVIVTNDDDRLKLSPPSQTDKASASQTKDDCATPSETAHQVSGNEGSMLDEIPTMPEFENPVAIEEEDNTKNKFRLSSDGKVVFKPNTNLEGSEVNQEKVDMGLLVLTRALLAVKSVLDRNK